jgi:putative ABC transport system substrate-binding protein
VSAQAQAQPAPKRIGFLGIDARMQSMRLEAFREGLRRQGLVEGRDIVLDILWADGFDRLPALAAELVARKVDVIVTASPPAVRAVKDATRTIPLVVIFHDPVGQGFAESLARPGGNLTGIAFQDSELSTKRVDLFRAVVPNLKRAVILWNRSGGTEDTVKAVEHAARVMGIETRSVEIKAPEDLATAVAEGRAWGAQGVIQLAAPFITFNRKLLLDALVRERMPATCEMRLYVEEGCLMTYSADLSVMFRDTAPFVAAILRGTRPGDLPIQQPAQFDFIVNLRTAETLGLRLAPDVRLQLTDAVR